MIAKWMLMKCILSVGVLTFFIVGGADSQGITTITGKTFKREYYEGEDALLTCLVSKMGNGQTIIWSKVFDGKKKILTIDTLRVTQDKRIKVLHDGGPNFNTSLIKPSGDVWVLSVKNITQNDSGGYVCRVNSEPPIQQYFVINVVTPTVEEESEVISMKHNYTKCCHDIGVSEKCLGFCKISNILEGSTGIAPEKCEAEFPQIVQCMADLRDHTPCCQRQGIPDICQDLCRGEYTVQEDLIQTHFSCTAYTEATLLCISEGIDILPRAPESVNVISSGSTSIKVEWQIPKHSPQIDNFLINITKIKKFDPPVDISKQIEMDGNDTLPFDMPTKMQIKVPGNATQFNVEKLSSLSWYEISVISINKHGSSIAPYKMRVLTKPAGDQKQPVHLKLPDIMGCCRAKGVKNEKCLQKLCNPHQRYIEAPDIIVCAAWASESFSCLTGDVDHSECCRAKGLPDKCVQLCSGNITQIDYTYFKCVDYYSDYRSCLLKGYGVLPGPPMHVKVTNIHSTFALLSWKPPTLNNNSVISFHSYFRPIDPGPECKSDLDEDTDYQGLRATSSPSVVENLCSDTTYEIYIQAFNLHGVSDPSSRIIFTTPKEAEDNAMFAPYNVTECCKQVMISPGCRPLCNYNPRMSKVRMLATICRAELPSMLKCVVGGRDHRPCCQRRGVPDSCQEVCAGTYHGKDNVASTCLPYLGNIMLCLEEGIGILPGPINGLHATEIINGKITLVWNPPVDGANITSYQVQYQMVDKYSSPKNFKFNNTINVTLPVVEIKNLTNKYLYSFLVLAMNEWGSSLPSSILTVNVTLSDKPKTVAGVVSAPLSMILEGKTATTLTVVWQPPAISLPTERLRYDVHYAPLLSNNDTLNYKIDATGANAYQITDLIPNTQYVIFTSARSDLGESRPSETLIAWTDPAYPAFVETPTVHPNVVIEGAMMTVLCIAMGSPPPKVSLYIAGKLVHEDITRHMVTIIKNVTRNMNDIACYADNGYGTPMQSVVSIEISHRPMIYAKEDVEALKGGKAVLECRVTAWPNPSMVWWLDPETRVPVIHGGNITMNTIKVKRGKYVMRMTLSNAEDKDYYCAATNSLGTYTHTIKLRVITEIKLNLNVTQCCISSNISQACIHACDFGQVDFHQIMNRDECIPDFEEFLKCGADGSDHRGCCSKAGMPGPCLDWCRGRIFNGNKLFNKMCLLHWAPTVFDCFHEGQEKLPGPPQNLHIASLSSTSAKVSWDSPAKNPDSVELYRIFWRANGTSYPFKSDTVLKSIDINNLIEGYTYEVAVKAGNIHGTSILSSVKTFKHHRSYISSQQTSGKNKVGIAFGVIFAIILAVLVVFGIWWVFHRRPMLLKGNKGVSFENPSYIREQGGDGVEIAETPTDGTNNTILSNGSSNNISMRETSSSDVWNTQSQPSTPGFDNDIDPKGGYTRFKS